MNLTRGRAFFHDPQLVRIVEPPAGAAHVYDLGEIRKSEVGGPIGSRWTLYATYLVFAAAAFIGWRMFMLDPSPAKAAESATAPMAAQVNTVARKRRKKKSQRRG
jgi:hypothetical protein